MLLGIESLYKISTVNLSLRGGILEAVFAKASASTLHVLSTTLILNAWKLEISHHNSC